MTKFLDELSDNEDEVFLKTPTFYERIFEYKKTITDLIGMSKMLAETIEQYVVPEEALMDRLGLRPSGR